MPKFQSRREAEKKLIRIKKRLDKLLSGVDVQLRDIKSLLSHQQYTDFEADWQSQVTIRYEQKPSSLKQYEDTLGNALMLYGKYVAASGIGKNVDTLKNKTDRAFEDAIEVLQETIAADQGLRVWFDREIDFGFDTDLGLEPERMPRVLTSRSLENKANINSHFGLKNRKQCKIHALELAQAELERVVLTDEQRAEIEQKKQAEALKLQGMLRKLKKSSV